MKGLLSSSDNTFTSNVSVSIIFNPLSVAAKTYLSLPVIFQITLVLNGFLLFVFIYVFSSVSLSIFTIPDLYVLNHKSLLLSWKILSKRSERLGVGDSEERVL